MKMGKMFRVGLLLAAVLGLAGCKGGQQEAAGGTAAATPAKSFRWKMVTSWPANFPVFQEGAERFAREVEQMSGGRLKIQVYAARELVGPLEVFDAVSQGSVQMGHGAAYYWAGKVPAAQFFSSVPFGMSARAMASWIYHGGGLELWNELYAPFNVVAFPLGNTGVQMGGWFNKKITSVEDLKGLKMRIPGLGGKVLKAAGGNPVLMGGGDLYTALERGTIDATEWVGPFHDLRLGLQRAAKYYYYPGWHEPGSMLELAINKTAWEELPEDLQTIVRVAAEAETLHMYTQFETLNLKALEELKQKYGIEVLEFPPEVMARLHRLTNQVLEEEAAQDPDFRRVYEAYQAFRSRSDAWSRVSDEAYERALRAQ